MTVLLAEENAPRYIMGVDLSGPSNLADTCLVCFAQRADGLHFLEARVGLGDMDILGIVSGLAGQVVLGIDAPLSYNARGGYRPSDRALRQTLNALGYAQIGVIAPTLTKMVYLTLRGINLARLLSTLAHPPRLVEVHPGAVFALRGAPAADVFTFKRDPSARARLLDWLAGRGLLGIRAARPFSDHLVAACGAALGAWQWSQSTSPWHYPAQPPEHPFDFAC